jgi:quinol monooxygenase YgiN
MFEQINRVDACRNDRNRFVISETSWFAEGKNLTQTIRGGNMIHVIATVRLKPGCRDKYLEILKNNVANVKGEVGCLVYEPTIDMETDIEVHEPAGQDAVTIVEAWESVEALKDHFKAPHMLSYREKAKDLFESISIRVLKPA